MNTLKKCNNMKQVIIYIILATFCASCSNDDEQIESGTEGQTKEIAQVLNGKFVGFEYSETTNTTKVCEITFIPYTSPKTEEWIENTTTKLITFYGICEMIEYYNDHLLEVDNTWKYSIDIAYDGAQPELKFYPDVYGRTESHKITIINSSSFIIDDVTYTKQEQTNEI